ncbi:hypothetical protein [Chitinophaga nivalis]|uniref:Lipoprotein n=1 Tax=Chitinophaga nivalis TaxID=2991709 RepID=A0ABT3IRN4_9BACT|nr:hypothetical protein [Chitinophaga nivalis]MCW3463668.1 hypothetical protein [Chitinophaga nivalis]MCW3486642.1 hypothetical protein [Chitinophaga nivalis]
MKMKNMIIFRVVIALSFWCFVGCRDSSSDGVVLAEEYCNCMESNHANVDYYNARILCDSKFAIENRYFRINYIESLYGNGYMGTLDKKTVDSVNEFTYRFTMYVSKHCPSVYNSDSIRNEYLKKLRK